ncbi:hypothetical protein [Streptomyces sp. 1222.5]|uniref:hypothetical protein n=1 Tax=Streptomyces sp. 1222.5 TaxID=1881026 RepID=UPI003D7525ED
MTPPWSTGPLIDEASGPLIYFPMRYSIAEEASTFAASLAQSMDLVCFDPQHQNGGHAATSWPISATQSTRTCG